MNCAIINTSSNVVENIAYVTDLSWNPGFGLYLVPLDEGESCQIGQMYDSNLLPRFYGTPAPVEKIYTAYQFLLRFTSEERAELRSAALTDPVVADFHDLAIAAQEISTTNQTTIDGMNYLVSAGLISGKRKEEILS
jgi:hypothetical protein